MSYLGRFARAALFAGFGVAAMASAQEKTQMLNGVAVTERAETVEYKLGDTLCTYRKGGGLRFVYKGTSHVYSEPVNKKTLSDNAAGQECLKIVKRARKHEERAGEKTKCGIRVAYAEGGTIKIFQERGFGTIVFIDKPENGLGTLDNVRFLPLDGAPAAVDVFAGYGKSAARQMTAAAQKAYEGGDRSANVLSIHEFTDVVKVLRDCKENTDLEMEGAY